jgi:uncharacterized alpha-E superfamily protein
MLSRVAENLYWIARYVERAENVARLLDVTSQQEFDGAGRAAGPLDLVLAIFECRDEFRGRHPDMGRDAVLRFLTFDRRTPASILGMIGRARENARGTQETLSSETWSQLNRLYLDLTGKHARARFRASSVLFYDRIKRACTLFAGLVDGTLARAEAYHFLQLGRYLERVDMTTRILGVRYHAQAACDPGDAPGQFLEWTGLLRSCSAYEAFLKEYQERIDAESVIGYLMLAENFPRALRFAVARCVESLKALTPAEASGHALEAERYLGKLDSQLRFMDVKEVFGRGVTPVLDEIQAACRRIGTEIGKAYFLH